MRNLLLVCGLLLYPVSAPAATQVSVGVSLPGLSIGINVPAYPELVRVPGYPVYYAPRLAANYFFYDGMYWVYANDNWYGSSWYDGPWHVVYPQYVPLFILRVPVYYYRHPPVYFRDWRRDAPPRWGQHWGRDWERERRGWDQWDRRAAPAPAPLPGYQRQYGGDRYPQAGQQYDLQKQHYRHEPRTDVVKQHYQRQDERRAVPAQPQGPQWNRPSGPPQGRDMSPPDNRGGPPQYQGPGPRRHDDGKDPRAPKPGQSQKHQQEDDMGYGRGR